MSGVREIVVNAFVSLDGVMQAPGGPQEYVASTTLEEVGWESSVLLANPVADSIWELKAGAGLKLVESRSFPGGAVLAEYRTGAAIEPGSFGPDEPSEAELKRRAKLMGRHV